MEITSDIYLKGSSWRIALEILSPFFPQNLQPNYSIYVISMSIGIMYDQQLEVAGEEINDETPPSVPRTVLHPHNTDLDFLFQAAILTSSLINFSDEERMKLAFDPNCSINFNKFEFLSKFANFGVGKLIEKSSDEPVETMENLKKFLAASIEGYNYEINSISDDELDEGDLDFVIDDLSN